MKTTHLFAIVTAFIMSILTIGCDDGQPLVDNQSFDAGTEQGIQITKQTETDLRVVAVSGDEKVTISIHRNGLRPSDAIRNPDTDSPYDSDILVRNRHGFPFVTSGNHGLPYDPDTGKAISSEKPSSVVHQEQIEDLKFGMATVEQLRGQDISGKQYSWELRSLYYMLDSALKTADDMLDVDSSISAKAVTGESVGVTRQAYTAPYTHKVWIKYIPIFWTAWQGDHSAILLGIYDSLGAFIAQVSTRNHGTEATDPSMYTAWTCPSTYSGRNVVFPAFQPFVNTDTALMGDAGGCNTPYDAIWPTTGGHVCNDDTLAQYWNIKYNQSGTYPTCSDSTLRTSAPLCE